MALADQLDAQMRAQLRSRYRPLPPIMPAMMGEPAPEPAPRPPVVRRPEPPPKNIRGRIAKYRDPDFATAGQIKAAGEHRLSQIKDKREQRMVWQSTVYLAQTKGRLTLAQVAEVFGLADHTSARLPVRAARDRLAGASADWEQERQRQIMRAVKPG